MINRERVLLFRYLSC